MVGNKKNSNILKHKTKLLILEVETNILFDLLL